MRVEKRGAHHGDGRAKWLRLVYGSGEHWNKILLHCVMCTWLGSIFFPRSVGARLFRGVFRCEASLFTSFFVNKNPKLL